MPEIDEVLKLARKAIRAAAALGEAEMRGYDRKVDKLDAEVRAGEDAIRDFLAARPAKEAEPDAWMWAQKKSVLGMDKQVDVICYGDERPDSLCIGVSNVRPLYLRPDAGQWRDIERRARNAAFDKVLNQLNTIDTEGMSPDQVRRHIYGEVCKLSEANPPSQQEDAG